MSKNKKIILIILSVFIVLSLFLGISYAYYIKSHNQENSNIVKTKCLNFSLTNEKNDINLDEQYPIPDSDGRKLTPYQFTITNTCDQFISYNVNLESLEATTMDSSAVKVMINNEAPVNLGTLDSTSVSIDGSKDSKILATGSLGSGDSVDYTLRLWMDYGTTADTSSMNKVFESKIVVTATVGTYKPSDYVTTLHDALLINEYAVTNVDNAVSKIEAKGTPDFTKTAPIITWQSKEETLESTASADTPHPDIIGNSDLGTDDLTSENILLKLGTSYNFDSITGYYNLTDIVSADPTTLDLTNNSYYYCNAGSNYDSNNNKVIFWQTLSDCSSILKLNKATKRVFGTPNTHDYRMIYDLTGIKLNQSEIESDKSDTGLYVSEDDYGKCYYYRGNVKNNVVKFADFYWRIIKINGDNSIRLLYVGTIDDLKNVTDRSIGRNSFNLDYENGASIGYMYGKVTGTRENNIKNEVDSNIKLTIDSWYISNLKSYSDYISDNGFCNDRNVGSNDGTTAYYSPYFRLLRAQPDFKCPNISNDLFTTSASEIGNKSLTYPIGLLTLDEAIYAGYSAQRLNTLNYMYSNYWFWTMSPSTKSSLAVANYTLNKYFGSNWVVSKLSIRPVINLKSNVEISSGIGTLNDPYVIKTS